MITEKDIWYSYQKAKGKDIEYPSDKKWESTYNKLSEVNKENINTLAVYLNTKWQNIDLDKYMETGFYLWKSFSYKHFLDQRLIDKYRQFDKSSKRRKATNSDLKESIKFILYNRYPLDYYGSLEEDGFSLPINDYLHGKISDVIVVYMMEKGYLDIKQEMGFIPYIIERYEQIQNQVQKKWSLLSGMEEVIVNKRNEVNKYE